ncbi:MAG: alkaline phosphatase family protein [Planctomycetes bacterium]|nr:alkaline phosphatase family protein [Planctomycetota bacterium]
MIEKQNSLRAMTAAALTLLSLLAASRVAPADDPVRAPAEPAPRPRLVVVVVLDQFRYDYLTRFEDLFDPNAGAFPRLKRRAAFFTNANYGHATTYTGPGHAHLLSGAYARQTGMVGNKWYDRATGKSVPIAGDPDAHWLGAPGDEGEGSSPRNFIGTTVGDELLLNSQSRSKVLAVALKCRAAILLGGKLGKAYWFNEKSGEFTTSTYYAKDLPAWVADWNKKRLPDSYFGNAWKPFVPESAFARASEDDAPFEGDLVGLGRVFPHPVTGKLDKPGEAFYDALSKTPFGNEVALDFAREAIQAEGLGKDDQPDLLAVSLSSNDEVGHTFGPYSREVLDMTVRTDALLGAFLQWLDVQAHGAVVVLTADHGASPIPEYMARLGVEAYRIKKKTLKEAVKKALDARYGEAEWVAALEDPSVYLNWKALDEKKLDHAEVESAAAAALAGVPGIAGSYTRTQLLRGEAGGTPLGRSYEVCFYPPRSGDVLLVTKPYSFWGKYAEAEYGDSHGSPYPYDTHVPLAIFGPGTAPGVYGGPVSLADLAPTLAALLGVNPPPGHEGRVLEEALKTH